MASHFCLRGCLEFMIRLGLYFLHCIFPEASPFVVLWLVTALSSFLFVFLFFSSFGLTRQKDDTSKPPRRRRLSQYLQLSRRLGHQHVGRLDAWILRMPSMPGRLGSPGKKKRKTRKKGSDVSQRQKAMTEVGKGSGAYGRKGCASQAPAMSVPIPITKLPTTSYQLPIRLRLSSPCATCWSQEYSSSL